MRKLQKASAEFAGLWERHQVAKRFEDHKTLIHPELGPIELDCQVLSTEDQSQALLVLTAPPHTEATRSCNCPSCWATISSPGQGAASQRSLGRA